MSYARSKQSRPANKKRATSRRRRGRAAPAGRPQEKSRRAIRKRPNWSNCLELHDAAAYFMNNSAEIYKVDADGGVTSLPPPANNLIIGARRTIEKKFDGSTRQWPNWLCPLDFREVPIDEAVARINAAGYFMTRNGDIYKVDPDGRVTAQRPSGFINFFASRLAREDDGKLISAGLAWRRSANRCEYDQIGYWPEDHDRPAKSYNLWRGWGADAKPGDCSIIFDHILNVIANGDKDKADYIINWCAHMVQRPWEKPGVALVLKGPKGTGKSLLTYILEAAVGQQNTLITADGQGLFRPFNWHLANKLLIGAEEAFFSGNRSLNDKLKHLLTGDRIEVEQKFGQRMSIKSMHRMIITSNHPDVVQLSDDERRFFVCHVSDKKLGDHTYFAPLWRVANGQDKATLAAFLHELKTRDIANWRPEQGARSTVALPVMRQRLVSLVRWRAGRAI